MALLGAEGLERVAAACHANTARLSALLTEIPSVEPLFSGPIFHEQALRLPIPTAEVLQALASNDVLGGFDLGREYPELGDALLTCATEMRSEAEMIVFRDQLRKVLAVPPAERRLHSTA